MMGEVESVDRSVIEIRPGFIVYCDMDGTLVDTDYANFLSYRRAIMEATRGKHDVEFSGERLNRETMRKQVPSLTAAQYGVIASLKAEYFAECLSETILNTALANLITQYSRTNETVLVTCCREKRAVETLRHHNLLEYFTRLICWECLPQGRSSNKYGNAISLMGANPKAALVFENDMADVEKAVLAGVPRRHIVITHPWLE